MFKKITILLAILILLVSQSLFVSAEPNKSSVPDNIHFKIKFKNDPTDLSLDSTKDTSFVKTKEELNKMQECECEGGGGTYEDPVSVPTNVINVEGIPLEYAIIDGEFTILERAEYHYYVQNAEQGWFNAAMGTFAKTVYNGYGSWLVYKGIDKIPYVSKVINTTSKETLHDYGSYAKAASSVMIQNNAPLWGVVASAPVPSWGTKEVVIYISETGADYSWHNRVRFVISPDNEVSYSTWYVD
ncbi:hypothetical protein RZN25_18435 [Bacillaceae bacterium S4-13-56]